MQTAISSTREFPAFDLARLLRTVFNPKPGERICVLIDLEDPREIGDFKFLDQSSYSIQRIAHDVFYRGLRNHAMNELGLAGGDLFAYQITGGSNLDLPEAAWTPLGAQVNLADAVYSEYDLILCISTFSATAPLTAFAKQYGFRGATLHGVNDIILRSGLAVDYNEVSKSAEKLRLGMTRADAVEIDFEVAGNRHTLRLDLEKQEAQKSHGLCLGGPDVANLPAGEIYYVPASASGEFPLCYEEGSIGLMTVADGRIQSAALISGNQATIDVHNLKLQSDPVTGELGELGFGTQELPVSGRDIQDEKILGTLHVATGRSDHLGGHLTPDKFADSKNATHDDILFSPSKTPAVNVPQVRMFKDGEVKVLIENFEPVYMRELLDRP
jgi:aminopeptidase